VRDRSILGRGGQGWLLKNKENKMNHMVEVNLGIYFSQIDAIN